MSESNKSEFKEQIDAVNKQIDVAQSELREFEAKLAEVEAELAELEAKRPEYALLQQTVDSVRLLAEQGAAHLFWGPAMSPSQGEAHLTNVVRTIEAFEGNVREVELRRLGALEDLGRQQDAIDFLAEDLFDLEEERESRQNEWVIEREETKLPALAQIMPWMRGFEDDRRFRKTLLGSLAASVLAGLLVPLIELPMLERDEAFEVPERFAQFIQKREQAPPPPPTPIDEQPLEEPEPEEPPETPPEEKPPEKTPEVAEQPKPAQQKSPREKVGTKGILAFRDSFSNLATNRPSANLGAKARINNAGSTAGRPERNMVTTLAAGSSGGINLAAVSRDVGGDGEIAGVETSQVASSIASEGGVSRPLSAGAAAGRTDEEIQIVFDRYKAALYRLYNRELRKDPTLQGQLVLQLTIEPDGSVSLCRLQASDMEAPELAQQVVGRVKTFDFGAKDVPAVTIVYPIDFLPTA